MKVYVETLPKGATEYGCDNCPYAEVLGINQYIINGEFMSYRDCVCKLDKTCGFRQGEKQCPLQSLTDHTKQVRKEVCEILEKRIIKYLDSKNNYRASLDVHSIVQQVMKENLDQIQGENECQK